MSKGMPAGHAPIDFGEKMLSAMQFGFVPHIEGSESIDAEPKPEEPQLHPETQNAE